MGSQRKYPQSDVKSLYALSAGRCAFPNCRIEIILEPSTDGNVRQIGEISHIVGHSLDGPRGNSDFPSDKLDSYENWILLCPNHHSIVDSQENIYGISILKQWKKDHELWVRESLQSEIPNVGFPELAIIAKAIASGTSIPSEDFSVTPPKEKMERNNLTNEVDILIKIGLSKSREVSAYIDQITYMDSKFPERLKSGFVAEYQRLRNNGLSGNRLFESMHQFACNGNLDFKIQAAGLVVLTYLFECCEVFEK